MCRRCSRRWGSPRSRTTPATTACARSDPPGPGGRPAPPRLWSWHRGPAVDPSVAFWIALGLVVLIQFVPAATTRTHRSRGRRRSARAPVSTWRERPASTATATRRSGPGTRTSLRPPGSRNVTSTRPGHAELPRSGTGRSTGSTRSPSRSRRQHAAGQLHTLIHPAARLRRGPREAAGRAAEDAAGLASHRGRRRLRTRV